MVTNEYGVSEYEMYQLEEWKQDLCSQINTKFGDERDSYLFDLIYVDDEEDAELVVYKKDSGDFQQKLKIYYLSRGTYSKSSTLDELVGDAENNALDRTVYIIDRENKILGITNVEEISRFTRYSSYAVGRSSFWVCANYSPDVTKTISNELDYDYIMENFDMDKARKISGENLVSFDEIIARIIKE